MEVKKEIDPKLKINEIAEIYPEVIEHLITEYNFYCFGCFLSDYETLEEGARVHGIDGEDFKELMSELNEIINRRTTEPAIPQNT